MTHSWSPRMSHCFYVFRSSNHQFMRRTTILSLVVFWIFLSCGNNKQSAKPIENKPMMEFADSVHDFGAFGGVDKDLVKTYDFWFVNTGDAALVINRVEPSCHCLTAEYTQKPVTQGERGFVRLIYDGAENTTTTHFYRTAVVYSNASNCPTTLVVEGEVQKE